MKMLKLLVAALAAVTMTFAANAAKTAKAVVADGGKTLKFVYDDVPPSGAKGTDWFSVSEADEEMWDAPQLCKPWCPYYHSARGLEGVETIVIDDSFADYTPRDCGSWFSWFPALKAVQGIRNLNLSQAQTVECLFCGCTGLEEIDLCGLDMSHITSTDFMFFGCKKLRTIVADFDLSSVTMMDNMFDSCESLERISVTSAFKMPDVNPSWNGVFWWCTNLVGGAGTVYDGAWTSGLYARIDGGVSAPGYFTAQNAPKPPLLAKAVVEDGGKTLRFVYDWESHGTKDVDWFSVAEAEAIDPRCDDVPWYGKREKVTKVVFDASFKDYQPTQCGSWFYHFEQLSTIENIGNLVTANVTDMSYMFGNCSSLMTLDVTGFDTANVTDMYSMFCGCSSLTSLDVSGFDTANVTDMAYMFDGCSSLTTLDVTGFDTANVTYMECMFYGCSSLEAICASDRFVTDQVSSSSSMFKNCSKLVGGAGTAYDSTKTDKTYARIDDGPSAPGYFSKTLVPTLFDAFAAGALNPKGATYNGFLGDETLGGTFTLVVKKPKKNSTAGAATLTKIDPTTGKKVKITGTVDVNTGVCGGDLAGLELNAQGVGGTLGGLAVQGAVDAAKAKNQDALAVMNGFNKQVYGLVFADAAGEEAYLTATFSTKGKVKVAGSYRGAKVSGSSTMCVGDAVCAVPFVWSKKGVTVTFVLWFDKATRTLVDVSGLGAGATLVDAGLAGGSAATYPFALDETAVRASVPDAITETFLSLAIRFDGKKFDAGKAAKVAYKNGELTVDTSKGDNVTGLKLSYSKGVLKGSFTVYAVTAGKLVKNKFTVAGVMVNGVGYAAGTSRKLRSIPVVLVK